VALVHVAHLKFAAESFASGGPSTTPLSTKLLALLQEAVYGAALPELGHRLEKLHDAAVTPGTLLLLRKGRRCALRWPALGAILFRHADGFSTDGFSNHNLCIADCRSPRSN
jgi:hypothetical protein